MPVRLTRIFTVVVRTVFSCVASRNRERDSTALLLITNTPPAPGLRSNSGTLYRVGLDGYSWTSTVTDTDAYFLDFHYNEVYPNSTNNRGYGFQLRCLQE